MNSEPSPAAAPAPRCAHLRTKAVYIPTFSATAFEHTEHDQAPVCWCNRTLGELGPDREPVDLPPCSDPGRDCYRTTPVGR